MIREVGQEYQEQVKLIQTVPSFKDDLSALRIISEIGADMTVFDTAGNSVLGRDLSLLTMKVLAKNTQPEFPKGVGTSNHFSSKSLTLLSSQRSILSCDINT